jgi:hypothetical protein
LVLLQFRNTLLEDALGIGSIKTIDRLINKQMSTLKKIEGA